MEESFFDKDIKSIWIDGNEEPDLVEARFRISIQSIRSTTSLCWIITVIFWNATITARASSSR